MHVHMYACMNVFMHVCICTYNCSRWFAYNLETKLFLPTVCGIVLLFVIGIVLLYIHLSIDIAYYACT